MQTGASPQGRPVGHVHPIFARRCSYGIDADLVIFFGEGKGSVKKGANLTTAMDVQAPKSFLLQGA